MLHIISQTSNEQRGEVAPPLEECSQIFRWNFWRYGKCHVPCIVCRWHVNAKHNILLLWHHSMFPCDMCQSVTFVKILIRMNVRIYSYQQNDTNEYPNIFILICLTRTNVRTSIRIENCTNIRIYSNIRQGFTL